MNKLHIDIEIGFSKWPSQIKKLKTLVRAAATMAFTAGIKHNSWLTGNDSQIELSILMSDDKNIQALNHQWREQDKPTNVLAFANFDKPPNECEDIILLGDIIIAYQTCLKEAVIQEKSLESHLQHLIIHGTLHLLGYDHMIAAEQEAMEALEIDIMKMLGLPNPYLNY